MSWTQKPLAKVAELCLGKMLDEKKNKGAPMPYLANINVRWGEFDFENLREMRFEPNEFERYGLKYGDIVMCEGGEPGRCAIWKDEVPGMMIQKALHRIRPNEELDYRFLFYSFLLKGRNNEFSGLFTGSTIKHLPGQNLAKVEVSYPSRVEQGRIADILSTYDDLIENNRRRIALLEQSARLLYREWFVHLRFPGHEHVKVVDGVPVGWERKPLGGVARLNYGRALKAEQREAGVFPVYGSSGIVGNHKAALSEGPGIIVGRKGNVGKTFWSSSGFFPIDTVYFVDAETSNLYLFYALQNAQFMSTDVAVPGLNRDVAHSRLILIPPAPMLDEFLESVTPMHQQIDKLTLYNTKLLQARDLLLPRLMNGEIQV
jgi:type I restriction enzyme S subunit